MAINPFNCVLPPLSSKYGSRLGQIQVYNSIFPEVMNILYGQLDQDQIKQCLNLTEYISFIHNISVQYRNDSLKFELNNKRINAGKLLDKNNEFVKTPANSGNSAIVNSNVAYNRFNNNRSISTKGDTPSRNTTFVNPYIKSPHTLNNMSFNNMYAHNRNENYDDADNAYYDNKIVKYNDRKKQLFDDNTHDLYDQYEDESIGDFDCENTYYKTPNNNSDDNHIDRDVIYNNCLNNLIPNRANDPSRTANLPCFLAMKGKCTEGSNCRFSHNPDILQPAYDLQVKELLSSPLAKKYPGGVSPYDRLHGNGSLTARSGTAAGGGAHTSQGNLRAITPSQTSKILWPDTGGLYSDPRSSDSGGTPWKPQDIQEGKLLTADVYDNLFNAVTEPDQVTKNNK